MRPDAPLIPTAAYPYTLAQREAHAEQHILVLAGLSVQRMEQAKSAHVAATYGVPHMVNRLKGMKARFRNELSISGEGK
jgi:hypothetical protein